LKELVQPLKLVVARVIIPTMRSSLACVVVTLPEDGEVLVPVDELV
jgi:hypothetical protein